MVTHSGDCAQGSNLGDLDDNEMSIIFVDALTISANVT